MPTPTDADIETAIRENAASGVAKATTDVGSVNAHPLRDQIEADRYLRSKSAASSRRRGLRLSTMVPPGPD
jgi:hypothetical protein